MWAEENRREARNKENWLEDLGL